MCTFGRRVARSFTRSKWTPRPIRRSSSCGPAKRSRTRFNNKVLSVKRGSVAFAGETIMPPEGLTFVDLKVIARIRTMAEGTKYEEKALGFIRDAEGDTVTLVQIAEALAEKLALDGTPEVVTAAP